MAGSAPVASDCPGGRVLSATSAHARALGDAPVLFLEDDAVVRPDARADEWASVDAFLRRASFDVYSRNDWWTLSAKDREGKVIFTT